MAYRNPFGWPTPLTDDLLTISIIEPLATAPESIAERLVFLAHLSFDPSVWSGRVSTYWTGLGNRILAATSEITVATWWEVLMIELPGLPLRDVDLLHEKNLLIRPATLPGTPVPDEDVLDVLRTHTLELRDRTRRWAKDRRDLRAADQDATVDDVADVVPDGGMV